MITTASGFFGGMTRVLVGRITLTAITPGSLMEVALYAGTSALVGYGVKMVFDCGRKFKTLMVSAKSFEVLRLVSP